MKITLEFDTTEQLASLISLRDDERDQLWDKINELNAEPLKFSLKALAQKVLDDESSLTPGQRQRITEAIENGI